MNPFPVIALRFPPDEKGLKDFSRALSAGGIQHQIIERGSELCLMVANEHYAKAVQAAWHSWQNGVQWKVVENISNPHNAKSQLVVISIPVTVIGLVLSLLGYALVFLVKNQVLPLEFLMTFVWNGWPKVISEPWRLVTPAFLHFSLLHIAFNSMWWWELAKSIERQLGSVNLLGLLILLAVVSNFAQGMVTMQGRFGGLSGVVYGLLAFNWLLAKLSPKVSFDLPPAVMPFMLAWLVICYTGIFSAMGLANIANEAHLGGLLGGFTFAIIFAAWQRLMSSNR